MDHVIILIHFCELSLDDAQHTATRCNTLQHTATHCNTLQHAAAHCAAVCCSILQCAAVCRNVLQCVAVGCSVFCELSSYDSPFSKLQLATKMKIRNA